MIDGIMRAMLFKQGKLELIKRIENLVEQNGRLVSLLSNKEDEIASLKESLLNEIVLHEKDVREKNKAVEKLKAEKEVLSSKRANIFEISNAFERGRKNGIEKFFDVLTKKYSQADILCPRRIISLTVREAEDLVKELTEVSNEN